MKQTKAQLQETNAKLNEIIVQKNKQLIDLQEDFDLTARRLDRLLAKDFSFTQEIDRLKSLTDYLISQLFNQPTNQ